MKAIEKYVLFMLYKVVLTCLTVDQTLKGDHSNETAVLSCGSGNIMLYYVIPALDSVSV